MAATGIAKTKCDGTIVINDGTAVTPLTYTVVIEPGNFTFTKPRFTYVDIPDRCAIVGSRKSTKEPGSLSFSVTFTAFTGSSEQHLIDMIDGTGSYAAAISTDAGEFEGNVREVVFTVEGTDHGDNADHVATFPKVRLEWDFAEGEPNTINVTGVILADPTFSGGTGA